MPTIYSQKVSKNYNAQVSLLMMKPMLIPYISRNNYQRHAVTKIGNQEESMNVNNEITKINMSVLLIEHSENEASNDFEKEFSANISQIFHTKIEERLSNMKDGKFVKVIFNYNFFI
jgi:hypothetical protein